MIYTFHEHAGENSLNIKGESHKYLVKVRRHGVGDKLCFRSKKDMSVLHTYELVSVEPRVANFSLLSSEIKSVKSVKSLHIAWCLVDTKSIEKILPSLCEIGVEKISFIYCERSQKNFKLDFKRFDRMQEASMQQSGRSDFIEFDTYKNIGDFIKDFPDTKVFDFCENTLKNSDDFKTVLIGCEGGFSSNERDILSKLEIFKLDTPMVLRSESVVLAVSSKILL